MNYLKSGHYLKEYKSSHHCRTCQRPHHTLLHIDAQNSNTSLNASSLVSNHTSMGILTDMLLMTCQVWVQSLNGSQVKVRALLDPASSSSFERVIQSLGISRTRHVLVSGLASSSLLKWIATVQIMPTHHPDQQISFNAVVVPCATGVHQIFP